MKGGLRKNICELDTYASLDKVEDLPACRKARIGDALEYACLFWAKHLVGVTSSDDGTKEVEGAIDEFSTTLLLFWIEALVIMENLDITLHAISNVQQWYTSVSVISLFTEASLDAVFRRAWFACGQMIVGVSSRKTLT